MVQQAVIDDDEVPQDIDGFFGHPLNSSFHNNDDAKALLHEYKSLPAIDKCSEDDSNDNECSEDCGRSRELTDCEDIIGSESSLLAPVKMSVSADNQDAFGPMVDELEVEAVSQTPAADSEHISKMDFDDNSVVCDEDNMLNEALNVIDNNILHQLMEETSESSHTGDVNTDTEEIIGQYLDSSERVTLENDCNNNDLQSTQSSTTPADTSNKLKVECEQDIPMAAETIAESNMNDMQDSQAYALPVTDTTSTDHFTSTSTPVGEIPSNLYMPQHSLPIHHPFQQLPMQPVIGQSCAHVVNQNDTAMTYPVMPRFMSPMVVQTSTAGPVRIQPVILNNGNICFTQPIPYRPHAQPYAPMGMQWGPAPFFQYSMGQRMICPDNVRMTNPQPMYYPHGPIQMMQPQIPVSCNVQNGASLVTPNVSTDNTMQPLASNHPKTESLLTCATVKSEPKMAEKPALPQTTNDMDQSHCMTSDQVLYKQTDYAISCDDQSNDTVQKACEISNIPHRTNSTYPKKHITAIHLKSPDSGFGETAQEMVPCSSESEVSNCSNPTSPSTDSNSIKRRRKSALGQSRLSCNKQSSNNTSPPYSCVKRENDETGYIITLDASTSCGAKLEDDRMTYLNKGQYYKLDMRNTLPADKLRSSYVKSVIILRFREDNSSDTAGKYWQFWHTHQPNIAEARGLDIDLKNSTGIIDNTLEYDGINSLTFAWDTHEPVQAQLAVHCLSTDFSSQKGVKGLPLHIQIDTYDSIYSDGKNPIHRAYAQIKIFCEKGAERKARDEEKRKEKAAKPSDSSGTKLIPEQFHPIESTTMFYSMEDLHTDAFIYKVQSTSDLCEDPFTGENVFSDAGISSLMDTDFMYSPAPKRIRLHNSSHTCIYVREIQDVAFTALHLTAPSTQALADAIMEKYEQVTDIRMLYKRTSRGMLVKIDDSLVKHFLHESMYVVDFKECPGSLHDITLTETDS